MRSLRMTFAVVLMLLTSAAFPKSNGASPKADTPPAQSDAQKLFEKLKSLAGSWDSDNPKRPFQVKFRMSSNGTAILSEMDAAPDNMVTVFHLDDGRLMMTHYCAAGNQPRMLGKMSPDGKVLEFDFLDATNLNSVPDGHMHRQVITVTDNNHHSEELIFQNKAGKEIMHVNFDLHRVP
jgi:hypothetical protein